MALISLSIKVGKYLGLKHMSNQALVRPAYIQEAKVEQTRVKAEREFFAYLDSDEGREAAIQGSEAVSLKKKVNELGKVTQVAYLTSKCPFKEGSLQDRAWYYGAWGRKCELERYLYQMEVHDQIAEEGLLD